VNLTRENTAIVLDSTSDFPDAQERFPNMRVVPLYVNFGSESFRDNVDIGSHDFYDRLRAAPTLPTTSQPTPQDFVDAYEQLAGYERIYSLQLSAKLSGTYQSAVTAAEVVGGDGIRVVDTETASLAVGMLALAIQRRLAAGTTDEEIEALIERFKEENRVVFTVATLEYLQKGGRIGRARALAGTLLNVKPILSIDDGVVHPIGKVRGRQKALEEFARVVASRTEDRPGLRLAIAHADAPEWIDVLTDLAARARPEGEIELVENLGAVVGTHAGPGAVGFFWFQD
jgi:DegV family protein with EDD domain